MRYWCAFFVVASLSIGNAQAGPTFSVGGVSLYSPCGVGPDVPNRVPQANAVAHVFDQTGYPNVSRWTNGNVWGSDFREGPDLDPGGGSDATNIYWYGGHGICQGSPGNATNSDFIAVCGNFGKPDVVDIGASSRWGNGAGKAQFVLLDASCPMDLVSLANQWFPPMKGLHVATGHSGSSAADTLDSDHRASDFAVLIASDQVGFDLSTFSFWWAPQLSVGDAWMTVGYDDIQRGGCCAVVIAAGATAEEAISRRDNEKLTDGLGNPTANWIAWRAACL